MDSNNYRATIHPAVDCGARVRLRGPDGRSATTWFIRLMRGRETSIPSRLLHGRAAFTTVIASAVVAALVGIGIGTNRQASSAGDGIDVDAGGASTGAPTGASTGSSLSPGAAAAPAKGDLELRDSADAIPSVGDAFDSGIKSRSDVAMFSDISLRTLFPTSRFWRAPGWSTLADRPASDADSAQVALYDGRPIRVARTITMRVTAYSPDYRSCGASADGITASGYSVFTNGGCMVAADPRVLPLGSLVSVPGYDGGAVVPVLDTGGAIKGNRLDVLYATHEVAKRWGVQDLEVQVWEYADGLPSDFKRMRRGAK